MAAQSMAGRNGTRIKKQPMPRATARASSRIRSDFMSRLMHEEMARPQGPVTERNQSHSEKHLLVFFDIPCIKVFVRVSYCFLRPEHMLWTPLLQRNQSCEGQVINA